MRSFALFVFFVQLLFAQTDLLKQKFTDKIRSITDQSDAIVGIAIKDFRSNEQILINEKEVFPTASSIKIFVLAEVYRQAAEGKFRMTDIQSIPAVFRVSGSGILSMLSDKSVSMSIRDYCVLMMNLSDNSATNLLIDLVGMKSVNDFAVKNGCNSTKLQRVMMDVQAAKEGKENISSPSDFLIMLDKLYQGELVSKQASDDMLSIMKLDKEGWLKSGLPSGISIANKAGDIEGIKCDVGIVYLKNAPYIICVMSKMLLNDSDGEPIITDISKATFQYLERAANSNQYGRRIPE
ncbi:MAG: serine hydrolase [Bacteriovoracaceae bacterium]